MKLTNYKEEYLPEILAFNQSVFPHRKNIEKSFEERFVLNPFSNRGLHQSSFVIDDENKIHGQFLLLPTQFHYQAKTYSGNFGFDFIGFINVVSINGWNDLFIRSFTTCTSI